MVQGPGNGAWRWPAVAWPPTTCGGSSTRWPASKSAGSISGRTTHVPEPPSHHPWAFGFRARASGVQPFMDVRSKWQRGRLCLESNAPHFPNIRLNNALHSGDISPTLVFGPADRSVIPATKNRNFCNGGRSGQR